MTEKFSEEEIDEIFEALGQEIINMYEEMSKSPLSIYPHFDDEWTMIKMEKEINENNRD